VQEIVVVIPPLQPVAAVVETTSETPGPVVSHEIVLPADTPAGVAASWGAALRSIVLLPRVRTPSVTPNFAAALRFPGAGALPVVPDAAHVVSTTERRSSTTTAPRVRAPREIVPVPTDKLPGKTPTQAPAGASAPPAGSSAGTFADFGTGARAHTLSRYYLSQRRVEALLPDGMKVTLAIDRPG
jgi:hypothetical protein